jgi:hypothetical protein
MIKTLDVLMQLCIGAASLAGVFRTGMALGLLYLLGWQLLSMVFHMTVTRDQPLHQARTIWGIVLGLYIALIAFTAVTVIFIIAALLLTGLAGVLFTLPYFVISVAELVTIPLSQSRAIQHKHNDHF